MTVKNDLGTAMDHTDTGREEPAIWQSSRPSAGANACTDGDNPRGANVVRFAPADYALPVDGEFAAA
jgi:hypothetical protein